MSGWTGCVISPKGRRERWGEISVRHGSLGSCDEASTGFGRLGAATASECLGVTPDLITMAKGISNAAIPAGAVAVKRQVYDAIIEATSSGIEFFHGYTY